jgi:uncharacterized protein (UPF0303 family)
MSIADDVNAILAQEKVLVFTKFDEADAYRLGSQMHAAAARHSLPLVIDIHMGQRQLFFAALPGTSSDNSEWVRRKVNCVLRYHKSTYRMNRELEMQGRKLDASAGVDPVDYAAAGGGFPIHITGTGVVGAVTVSGIPQRDDHGFVVEQLCIFLKQDHARLALGPEGK